MKRRYIQRARAEKALATRRRILDAARKHLPAADQLRIEEIAELAAVSVQTLYSHFGSKTGLIVAVFDQAMGEAGLYAGFDRVWQSRDGEAALRAMLDATLRFWQRAWPLIAFALRVRRTDLELGGRIDAFDQSRLGHLEVICRRLQEEGRLASGLSVPRAARLSFGLTTPYVYEALVMQTRVPAAAARSSVVEAVVGAVLKRGSKPVPVQHIDWPRLRLTPPAGQGASGLTRSRRGR